MLGHERLDQVWKAGRQRYTESLHVHGYNSLDFISLKNQAESSWSVVQMYEWEGHLELLEVYFFEVLHGTYFASIPLAAWICKLISDYQLNACISHVFVFRRKLVQWQQNKSWAERSAELKSIQILKSFGLEIPHHIISTYICLNQRGVCRKLCVKFDHNCSEVQIESGHWWWKIRVLCDGLSCLPF